MSYIHIESGRLLLIILLYGAQLSLGSSAKGRRSRGSQPEWRCWIVVLKRSLPVILSANAMLEPVERGECNVR